MRRVVLRGYSLLLLTGTPPFNGQDDTEIIERVRKGEYELTPLAKKRVSGEAIDLLRRMLVLKPESRLSSAQVLDHPWLKGLILHEPKPFDIQAFRQFQRHNLIKKAGISLLSTQITDREIEDIASTFKKMDSNGDGFLSAE